MSDSVLYSLIERLSPPFSTRFGAVEVERDSMGWYLCGRLKGFYQVGRELDRSFTTKAKEKLVSIDHSFAPILP